MAKIILKTLMIMLYTNKKRNASDVKLELFLNQIIFWHVFRIPIQYCEVKKIVIQFK